MRRDQRRRRGRPARQGSKGSWANGVHRIRGMDDCVGRCVACMAAGTSRTPPRMRTARGIGLRRRSPLARPRLRTLQVRGPTPTSAARSTARRARAPPPPTSRPSPPTARGAAAPPAASLCSFASPRGRGRRRRSPPRPTAAGGRRRSPLVRRRRLCAAQPPAAAGQALRCDGGGTAAAAARRPLARRLRTLHAAAQRSRCAAMMTAPPTARAATAVAAAAAPFEDGSKRAPPVGVLLDGVSTYKPWTALRVGRAFLTPTAPGLVHPPSCAGRRRRRPRVLVRAARSAVRRRGGAPQLRFNLMQLQRESLHLHGGAAIPEPFRQLGAFWWASQLLARLLTPAPRWPPSSTARCRVGPRRRARGGRRRRPPRAPRRRVHRFGALAHHARVRPARGTSTPSPYARRHNIRTSSSPPTRPVLRDAAGYKDSPSSTCAT